jgi:hypothetical protein
MSPQFSAVVQCSISRKAENGCFATWFSDIVLFPTLGPGGFGCSSSHPVFSVVMGKLSSLVPTQKKQDICLTRTQHSMVGPNAKHYQTYF